MQCNDCRRQDLGFKAAAIVLPMHKRGCNRLDALPTIRIEGPKAANSLHRRP
jgi:hypothetical protein